MSIDHALASALRPRGPVSFELSKRSTNGVTVIGVAGELDLLTAARLGSAIDAELRSGGGEDLVVDLRRTTFVDSAGLHILLNAHRRLVRRGRALSVVCSPGPVRRVFELAKLVETLGVVARLQDRRRTQPARNRSDSPVAALAPPLDPSAARAARAGAG